LTQPMDQDRHSRIILRSNRLEVEIAAPETAYRGTRFDWSGFTTQVTLDEKHTFCAPEAHGEVESTGGIGLCNEFGNDLPVGYEDAKPGEAFPKLGIGLLVRPDEMPYNFFRTYEIAKPFPIEVETIPHQACFTVQPVDCRGYAVRLVKTVRVEENLLTFDYQLENTGSNPTITNEYCHNFLCINEKPIGLEYCLRLPYTASLEPPLVDLRRIAPPAIRWLPRPILQRIANRIYGRMQGVLEFQGQEIHWKSIPSDAFYGRLQGFFQTDKPQWELVHSPSGVGLREIDNFPPVRVAIWGRSYVASAEVFVGIKLQPGESQTWSRRYEFFGS
jgi:hypothetical protein